MPRIALSAIALILIWLAPVAAAPPTTWTATPPIQPSMKTIPPPALETLRRSLKESAGLLPAPDKPYVLLAEETKIEVDPGAPWHPRLKVWERPAHATAVRTYDVPADAPGIPEELRRLLGPIEVTVELNGEKVTKMDVDQFTQPNKRPDGTSHKFDIAYKDHPRKGYIGLQDHGADCWFKNIKLRPLS